LHKIHINRFHPSLFKKLHGKYKIKEVHAVKFGIDNESVAKKKYQEVTSSTVVETGLHLFPCGFLGTVHDCAFLKYYHNQLGKINKSIFYIPGGSPDGKVDDDKIIEIKCSYVQYCTKLSYKQLAEDPKRDFCLTIETNDLKLKTDHDHYHQIQGNIYATNTSYCDFFYGRPRNTFFSELTKTETGKQI